MIRIKPIQNNKIQNRRNKSPKLVRIKEISNGNEMISYFPKELLALKNNSNFSPLSGSELPYDPEKWNEKSGIRTTHNCYSYALGKIRSGLNSKAQPGYASGHNHINNKDYECKEFYDRLRKDSPGTYLQKFDIACKPGFYKIFLALDPQNDYHWWRQDGMNNEGYWSHKPGSTEVKNVDASGKKISNPLLSDRNFKSLNYHKPCFFACIYSDLSKSMSTIYGRKPSFYF
jgi:hypothetical protein